MEASVARERLSRHGLHAKVSQEHHSTLRRASILILLSNDGKILLTQRTLHLKSHPGEVCFPGGKQDEEDLGDDWTTGIRETLEEVGLFLTVGSSSDASNTAQQVGSTNTKESIPTEKLCVMNTVESLSHLCVTPVVCFVDLSSRELSAKIEINPSEVELHFWVPLDYFVHTEPDQSYEIEWQGAKFLFRKYLFGLEGEVLGSGVNAKELPITGLTAHVAHEVATVALDSSASKVASSTMTTRQDEHFGYLWRLIDADTPKPYWSRRYFVLSNTANNQATLHQYDTEHAATRKSQSASKKNRLLLFQGPQTSLDIEDFDGVIGKASVKEDISKFSFRISVLDGRIKWYLAAASSEERTLWKQRISLYQS